MAAVRAIKVREAAKGSGEEIARATFSTCGARTIAAMADRLDFATLSGTLYVSHKVGFVPPVLKDVEDMINTEVVATLAAQAAIADARRLAKAAA